ncbi:bacterioferritin [Neorickettsia sennetsu]|uniref:Bacterioferritin n=1 Tax=Ehrlichia sennetsu (strain ATCC VR-367 / Miyayama) TaxID=222891 RepID=Q2GE61_EHRS3|nr:bacterioferritin [Neorickettsia sennetsu]ABD46282.1 bacterioferritin [Neorickettsia sennetsu str. Miyayama]
MTTFSSVERLNEALERELLAINQYFIHSKVLKDMGLLNLSEALRSRSIGEMHHADALLERIFSCKGNPKVCYKEMGTCPRSVEKIFEKDRDLELEAISSYRKSIAQFEQNEDFVSSALMRSLLQDEEKHLEWLEQQLSLIQSLGIQQYLVKHG